MGQNLFTIMSRVLVNPKCREVLGWKGIFILTLFNIPHTFIPYTVTYLYHLSQLELVSILHSWESSHTPSFLELGAVLKLIIRNQIYFSVLSLSSSSALIFLQIKNPKTHASLKCKMLGSFTIRGWKSNVSYDLFYFFFFLMVI